MIVIPLSVTLNSANNVYIKILRILGYMKHISACETVEVLNETFAWKGFFDFSKQLSCENKTQRRIFIFEQSFLFISLFKMGVEIRCVARPLFTLLLDRNLK